MCSHTLTRPPPPPPPPLPYLRVWIWHWKSGKLPVWFVTQVQQILVIVAMASRVLECSWPQNRVRKTGRSFDFVAITFIAIQLCSRQIKKKSRESYVWSPYFLFPFNRPRSFQTNCYLSLSSPATTRNHWWTWSVHHLSDSWNDSKS